jgi:hypothetical protein
MNIFIIIFKLFLNIKSTISNLCFCEAFLKINEVSEEEIKEPVIILDDNIIPPRTIYRIGSKNIVKLKMKYSDSSRYDKQ